MSDVLCGAAAFPTSIGITQLVCLATHIIARLLCVRWRYDIGSVPWHSVPG